VLKALGDLQQFRDDRDAALESYQQALTRYQEIGAKLGEANVLKALGDLQQFRKQSDAALESYQQALTRYQEIGAKLGEANVLAAHGQLILIEGNHIEARHLLEQAISIYQVIGSQYSIPAQMGNYGWALQRNNRFEEARPYLLQAAELFETIGLNDYAERHRQAAEATYTSPSSDFMHVFAPILQVIAAVATGDETARADLEVTLAELEQRGWQLTASVRRIWDEGERDVAQLTAGLDEQDTALITRVLELIADQEHQNQ
jgi:tetratricopeptide (TPR) repeat protein